MSASENRRLRCIESYRAEAQKRLQAGDKAGASKYTAWADMVSEAPWLPGKRVVVLTLRGYRGIK